VIGLGAKGIATRGPDGSVEKHGDGPTRRTGNARRRINTSFQESSGELVLAANEEEKTMREKGKADASSPP